MAGITSIGAYIPRYRLPLEEIAKFWHAKNAGGEKAVAGFDEDTVTMAVAASLDCLARNSKEADGLYFATTSAPYKEKQCAALIASAVDLKRESHTADFANSLRSGSIAIRAAVDAVKSGSAKNVLVVASDCRLGATQGRFEQLFGDGAAALEIGSEGTIADLECTFSVFSDFADLWRKESDLFIQSADGRFAFMEGVLPTIRDAVSGVMRRCAATPKDFKKFVYYASDGREHANLAKQLGFEKSQIQDPMFSRIGNAGTAASLLMLVAALEDSQPGDRILYAAYGDGCDAMVFHVTENITAVRAQLSLKDKLEKKIDIDYGKYLSWRDIVPIEFSTLPQRPEPSVTTRWRERHCISALYGVRCKKCGTPQLHPLGQRVRVCIACQEKDNFDAYRFSDKKGKLYSYSIDHLQPSKNPPGLNGIIDFDGGGRLICELTDCNQDMLAIDMAMEMTFRKMYQGHGIINYFWKAQPVA